MLGAYDTSMMGYVFYTEYLVCFWVVFGLVEVSRRRGLVCTWVGECIVRFISLGAIFDLIEIRIWRSHKLESRSPSSLLSNAS